MSEENKSPEEESNALDLSGLNFGPAWARSDKESKSVERFKKRGDRADRDGGERRGGGRREGGQRGGGRRQGGGRDGGARQERRGGGGGRGGERRGPRREEVAAPEGVSGHVMPVEESLDKLAKEIKGTGRTYSVFDLAKFLLQSRDRYQVNFQHDKGKFLRCVKDNSLWLSRDEALSHLAKAEWRGEFYAEVKTEGEAPKGSFQSVAKCGISGVLLGPPNYHAYQANLAKLHRERFSHMDLDRFRAKVVMEHGEEAVEAWIESMKTVTKWRPLTAEEKAAGAEETPEAQEVPQEEPEAVATGAESAAAPEESAAASEEGVSAENAVEESAEAAAEVTVEESSEEVVAAEATAAEEVKADDLLDEKEVEAHFLKTHFDQVFVSLERAWVPGDIKGNLLSPGLLTILKNTVAEERRYPGKLTPVLCRQLSGRHVAVYKWKKKLKAGPSRPHAIPDVSELAERPRRIIDWLGKNSGAALAELWKEVLPEDATDEVKHKWFHDLHWLLNQGFAIFLSDMTLHLSKKGQPQEQVAAKEEKASEAPEKEAKKEEKEAASEKEEAVAESETSAEAEATPEVTAEEPQEEKKESAEGGAEA
ncbi:MAG: hypothetical protein ACQKBY_11655 [Verrucomicrobiales bacterium]